MPATQSLTKTSAETQSTQETLKHRVPHSHTLIAAVISGATGAGAAFIFQGAKKRLQTNQSLPKIDLKTVRLHSQPFRAMTGASARFLRESFRGVGGYIASSVPTSVTQQMARHEIKERGLSKTTTGKIAGLLFSGGLGGVASTVVENTTLEQQLKKIGPTQAVKNLLHQGGVARLFVGLPLIFAREAVFGAAYLDGSQIAAKEATDYFRTPNAALPAMLGVGVAGSLLSHPFDTVASTMQHKNFKRARDAASYLYQEGGLSAFYKGGLARVGLFTTAMLTMVKTTEIVINTLNEDQLKIRR